MCDTVTQHFVSQNLHGSDIPCVTHLNNLKSIQPQFALTFGFVKRVLGTITSQSLAFSVAHYINLESLVSTFLNNQVCQTDYRKLLVIITPSSPLGYIFYVILI